MKKHLLVRRSQEGFSLVELMIVMALSLVLMLGVYKLFDVQERSFKLISSLNDREDNALLAMKILSDDIRMADHWGGSDTQVVRTIVGSLSAYPGACQSTWIFDVSKGVYGVEGESSITHLSGLPHQCINHQNYLAYSDLLSLRFGDSRTLLYENEIDNKRYQKHYFLRSQSGKSSVVFQGKELAQAVQILPDEGYHYNVPFNSSLYFLRPCLKNRTGCIEGVSTLTRLVLMGDRYVQEPLVEGIEQIQFEYGVDDTLDGLVDQYVTANNVKSWRQVLSVKIFLLVRNRLKDLSIDETGKNYVMNSLGSQVDNVYRVPEEGKHYSRKLYQREVVIRSRLNY